ncbi:MAG: hypothetical protein EXR72_26295 [Myxococcales bacterium]|nr:hypothetical protein [Myxococcales bacterium]
MRKSEFVLGEAIRAVNFTPRVADVAALIALLGGDDEAAERDAERALQRVGEPAAREALERISAASPPLRARLARVAGRIASTVAGERQVELTSDVIRLLADRDAKTRRNAILALGKLPGATTEEALLAAWAREERVHHRRSIAASLGKIGGARSLALLSSLVTDDAELRRITDQARLILGRNLGTDEGTLDPRAAAPYALPSVARCRGGLEALLAEELAAIDPAWHPKLVGPGCVRFDFTGPLERVFGARTLLDFGFALPAETVASREAIPDAVARALSSEMARDLLGAWTRGPVRYRIEWASGGKRRAELLRCVQAVGARRPELQNDPSRRTWEASIHEPGGRVSVELTPRLDDPRFRYRVKDVPAASHPTVAAALARIAGARPDDVVWDPFVGSGSELVERARLGPFARLIGTDLDPRAIDAARQNLAAAGFPADLTVGDACTVLPFGVTLVITNPPMGLRVLRGEDLGDLFDRFLDHLGRLLRPGARVVFLSPLAARTAARAKQAGFAVTSRERIDLGGFAATVQVLQRVVPSPTARR